MKRLIFFAIILLILLTGCSAFQRGYYVATTMDPETGKSPVQTVVETTPRLVVNPYDISNWVTVGGAIAAVLGGMFASKRYTDKKVNGHGNGHTNGIVKGAV